MSNRAFKNLKHKWQSTSVRRRLLLTLGTGAMALVFMVGAAIYMLLVRIEGNLWASRQNDAARNASLAIASYVGQVSRSLDGLGLYEIADVIVENQDYLPTWLNDNPEFREVIVLSADGTVLGAAARGVPILADPQTATGSTWFSTAAAGFPMMSQLQIAEDNSPYIIMARPGDNGGVVAARLQMDLLWDVVGEVRFGETGIAYIVEKTGTVVGHPDISVVLNRLSLAERPEWEAISKADNFAWQGEYQNFQQSDVVARTQAIANSDWVIFTELDSREASATARLAVSALSLSIVGIGAIALIAAARMMNTQIFVPLNSLRRRARRIAQGEFKQIEVKQLDELGELAQAFNDMSKALKDRDERIAAQNHALSQEVSERKQAQESVQRANAELIEASQYKDQFLATMSHELRTPLNAILGMSEALIVPVYGPLNPQQRKAVLHVQDSGRHLLKLIDDMLDLSKITAGRSPLDFSGVRMESLVENTVRMIRPILNAKKLIFHNKLDPEIKSIMADERRLKQIIVNLLNNACKFTDDGGHVGLEIRGDAKRGVLSILVSDTGVGIPKSQLERIFEPFVQADGGSDRQHGGAGLGLTLVNRIVEMHGGSVKVVSEIGRGSRFTVEIPWRPAAHIEPVVNVPEPQVDQTASRVKLKLAKLPGRQTEIPVPAAASKQSDGKRTILLVEDREANIVTLIDYLTVKGFEVLVARSGKESLEMARKLQPDIILMDIHMPEMSGIEATEHLRSSITTRTIPIVAVTALAMPGDRERCLAAGANDYVSKPISLRDLLETIEAQLDGSQRAKPKTRQPVVAGPAATHSGPPLVKKMHQRVRRPQA